MSSNRGKRYAIDTEHLLKDATVYYLAYVGSLSTENLKVQLKENKLNYTAFKALEDNHFPIRSYWLKEGEQNTVQIKEDLLYETLTSVAKYKKLANKIEGFMNIRQFKPLKAYMEFCDSINTSYLTFCDDEDYKDYFEELEKQQFRTANIADESQKPECTATLDTAVESKPKAYIKGVKKEYEAIPCIKVHWNEDKYGDDVRSIVGTLCHTNFPSQTYEVVHPIIRRYADLLFEDLKTALYVEYLRESLGVYIGRPTYADYLTNPVVIYSIAKVKTENVIAALKKN